MNAPARAAAARAVGAPVEVLEAMNVVLPSGLVVPDLVVTDVGATAEDSYDAAVECHGYCAHAWSGFARIFHARPALSASKPYG